MRKPSLGEGEEGLANVSGCEGSRFTATAILCEIVEDGELSYVVVGR